MSAPPYSSGTVMPSTPRSPSLRPRSIGNWSVRSISAARGAISACAKSRTASRSASMSAPRSKSSPGSCIGLSSSDFLVCYTVHDHQRLLHRGYTRTPVALHTEDLGAHDGQRPSGLEHFADGDQQV